MRVDLLNVKMITISRFGGRLFIPENQASGCG